MQHLEMPGRRDGADGEAGERTAASKAGTGTGAGAGSAEAEAEAERMTDAARLREPRDFYGALYRVALFRGWEAIRRRPTMALLGHLERSQWLSLDELVARQTAALRRLLWRAHEDVPFYARRFREHGVSPDDVRSPDDMLKLPLLTREDVREFADERVATKPPFPVITKTTSGSSGRPITIRYDAESEWWRQAVKWRGYSWAGLRPGDRILHYWGPPQVQPKLAQRAKIAADRLIRRELYVDCVDQSARGLQHAVDEIRRFRPHAIISYAQAAGNLARFVLDTQPADMPRVRIIPTAEQLLDHDRVDIERAFGKDVFNSYGSRETMLLAMECEAHDGLHVPMENILLEILVTEGDGRRRPAKPGELGEVVVTDLHNSSSPLIRYANGDLARAAEPGACRCGRAHTRIAAVEGRKTDTLVDGYGGRVQGMLFPVLMLPLAQAVKHYQAVQKKDRSIVVKIVPTEKFDTSARALILDRLGSAIRGVKIDLEVVDTIPVAPSGKQRPVVVES